LGEFVVGDSFCAGCRDCLVKSSAQQAHLDKIVEMTGLQRGILPIVGKAEEFLL
jgi:hypothetical protein